jgi:hypothetical protein
LRAAPRFFFVDVDFFAAAFATLVDRFRTFPAFLASLPRKPLATLPAFFPGEVLAAGFFLAAELAAFFATAVFRRRAVSCRAGAAFFAAVFTFGDAFTVAAGFAGAASSPRN